MAFEKGPKSQSVIDVKTGFDWATGSQVHFGSTFEVSITPVSYVPGAPLGPWPSSLSGHLQGSGFVGGIEISVAFMICLGPRLLMGLHLPAEQTVQQIRETELCCMPVDTSRCATFGGKHFSCQNRGPGEQQVRNSRGLESRQFQLLFLGVCMYLRKQAEITNLVSGLKVKLNQDSS